MVLPVDAALQVDVMVAAEGGAGWLGLAAGGEALQLEEDVLHQQQVPALSTALLLLSIFQCWQDHLTASARRSHLPPDEDAFPETA